MRVFFAMVAVGALCAVVSACGSDSTGDGTDKSSTTGDKSSDGGGSSSTGGGGVTECGPAKCPAGQYCVANTTCNAGCTSNQNCADGQPCIDIDDVSHVGKCQQKETKDCAAFMTKCNACNGGALCSQSSCDALSAACVNCVATSNCDDTGKCPCQ